MKLTRFFGSLAAMFLISCVAALAAGEGKCIPVKKLNEDGLAFKGGEKLVFTIHYKWGIIHNP